MRAQSSGSEASGKDAALFAALLAKHPQLTLWALVNDGRFRETAVQAELELVGWSLTETEATLSASV